VSSTRFGGDSPIL